VRPVPVWVSQVALPIHGEEYLDYWAPLWATFDDERMTGTLVLSNLRLLFLRGTGPPIASIRLQSTLPLESVHRLVGENRHDEGTLSVNHDRYSFHAATPEIAGQLSTAIARTIASARTERLAEIHRPPPPVPPPPFVVHRETVREIVKIPCRYCGALVEVTSPRCFSCGAPLARA
jgi:hypothetical protein